MRSLRPILALALLGACCLLSTPAPEARAAVDDTDILLVMRPGQSVAAVEQAVRPMGWALVYAMQRYPLAHARTLFRIKRGTTANPVLRETMMMQLRAKTGVDLVEQNVPFALPPAVYKGDQSDIPIFDDQLTLGSMYGQPALELVGAKNAQRAASGTGVKVAVLDGGFDLGHEALLGRTILGYDALSDDYDPQDLGNRIDDDRDGMVDRGLGHGTAVAGVVAATSPGARIIPIRVLDDEGKGTAVSITLGIYYAIDAGAQVINISASSASWSWSMEAALRAAALKGIAVIGTPGNGGYATVNYPGASTYVIPVAGITQKALVDYTSNYGPPIDLSAPSVDVIAPCKNSRRAYARWPGTSFAAPFVTGGTALVLEKNKGATGAYCANLLLARLHAYVILPPDRVGKYGKGYLDVDNVVVPPLAPAPTISTSTPTTTTTYPTTTYPYTTTVLR